MRFRSDPSQIRGSIAPVVTPFTSDGGPDPEGLRRLVAFQLANGSHGISLGGSTGEPSAQTVAERADAIRLAGHVVGDRVPFLPGTGSAKFDETLELTSVARDAGADAALVITPYYARPTEAGQIRASHLLSGVEDLLGDMSALPAGQRPPPVPAASSTEEHPRWP